MGTLGSGQMSRAERTRRRRVRSEKIETALIIALAGLVLFKGAPAIAGIAVGIGEMITAVLRVWNAA